MDIIAWLQNWVDSLFKKEYFNDSYEYDGIDIMGDNNIWKVNICVSYTYLEKQRFNAIIVNNNYDDWVSIKVENGIYKAQGDKTKLLYIINVFKEWDRNVLNKKCKLINANIVKNNSLDVWLQNWFIEVCGLNLKKGSVICISTLDNPGWVVEIDIKDTKLENKEFSNISIDNGDDDWVFIKVENNKFTAYGDNLKLFYIIQIFKDWYLI